MTNVIEINSGTRPRTINRDTEIADDTFVIKNTIKLNDSITHDSISNQIVSRFVSFDAIPKLTYFIFNYENDPTGKCATTGLYLKISNKKAILILDEFQIYKGVTFPDVELGKVGEKYDFELELVTVVNSDISLSIPKN